MSYPEGLREAVVRWQGFGSEVESSTIDDEVDLLLECIKNGLKKGYRVGVADGESLEKGLETGVYIVDIDSDPEGEGLSAEQDLDRDAMLTLEILAEKLKTDKKLDLVWMIENDDSTVGIVFPLDEAE